MTPDQITMKAEGTIEMIKPGYYWAVYAGSVLDSVPEIVEVYYSSLGAPWSRPVVRRIGISHAYEMAEFRLKSECVSPEPTITEQAKNILEKPYHWVLTPHGKGYWSGIHEFQGCTTEGRTATEAMDNLYATAVMWLENLLGQGLKAPEPAESTDAMDAKMLYLLKDIGGVLGSRPRTEQEHGWLTRILECLK